MKRMYVKHTDRIGAASCHMELTRLPREKNRILQHPLREQQGRSGAVGTDVLGADSVNEKI